MQRLEKHIYNANIDWCKYWTRIEDSPKPESLHEESYERGRSKASLDRDRSSVGIIKVIPPRSHSWRNRPIYSYYQCTCDQPRVGILFLFNFIKMKTCIWFSQWKVIITANDIKKLLMERCYPRTGVEMHHESGNRLPPCGKEYVSRWYRTYLTRCT